MTKRGTWIALGGVLGTLVLMLLLAWLWWIPSMIEARALSAVRDRLGMDATIGSVGLRPAGAVLDDVALTGSHGGVRVEIDELRVHASPWDVITGGGSDAVDRVVARDVRVVLDTADDGFRASIDDMREAYSSRDDTGDGGDVGEGRTYEASDLRVEVHDERGAWLEVDGARLLKTPTAVEADTAEAHVGRAPSDEATIEGAALRLQGAQDGWQLERLWAASAEVVRADTTQVEGAERSGHRLRALVAAARGAPEPSPPEPKGAPSEPDAGTDGDAETDTTAPPTKRAAQGDADRSRTDGLMTPSGALARIFERLAPDADVGVDSLTVRSRAGDGERTILRDLDASLRGEGDGVFRAQGKGQTADRGTLTWDLELEPEAARIEGRVGFEQLPLALLTPFLPELPWHEPDQTRLGGELVVAAESPTRFAVDGRVGVAELGLASERIAEEPVTGIAIRLEGKGHWLPVDRRLEIDEARVVSGKAAVELEGAVEWAPQSYLFDLRASMPPTGCNDAIAAIPSDLLGDLRGFSWQGQLAAYVVAEVDSRELDDARLDIRVADGCEFATVPAMADLRRFDGPFVHEVVEPDGSTFETTTGPGTQSWVPIRTVSPFLVHAVLAHEDAGFFRHHGFAPWAIEEALRRNLEAGRFVLGASTISMQLAKNLFLRREKTLARKVQEALLTWWLEKALDKRDILELYLNVIEYGPDIYGIRHAARHYFGREPVALGPAESAFLASILPAPKRRHSAAEQDGLSGGNLRRVRRLLEHMHTKGRLDRAALDYALAQLPQLDFHQPGEPPPEPREIPGGTGPLPFRVGEGKYDTGDDPWGDGDPMFDASDTYADGFEEVPEVDPDDSP